MPVRLQVAVKLLVAVSASLLGASCIQHDDAVSASVIGESRDLVATQQRLSAIAERHGLDPARYIDEPQNAIDRGSSSAIKRLADDLRYGATPLHRAETGMLRMMIIRTPATAFFEPPLQTSLQINSKQWRQNMLNMRR